MVSRRTGFPAFHSFVAGVKSEKLRSRSGAVERRGPSRRGAARARHGVQPPGEGSHGNRWSMGRARTVSPDPASMLVASRRDVW